MATIEEILGFTTSKDKSHETITRRYAVRETDPATAKAELEKFAKTLSVPAEMELG